LKKERTEGENTPHLESQEKRERRRKRVWPKHKNGGVYREALNLALKEKGSTSEKEKKLLEYF